MPRHAPLSDKQSNTGYSQHPPRQIGAGRQSIKRPAEPDRYAHEAPMRNLQYRCPNCRLNVAPKNERNELMSA